MSKGQQFAEDFDNDSFGALAPEDIAFFDAFVPFMPSAERDSWAPEDDIPDVEDADIESEIDRYFRQVEDSYSDADFNAQMEW